MDSKHKRSSSFSSPVPYPVVRFPTVVDASVVPSPAMEKENMFEKVVTPSDLGKLNRLVIPKQHAEKYFPLDSSTKNNGLLLTFEDSTGKSWMFRYSYWNSSQSYVMTKGWSRFVKEKRLKPGDTVFFRRGVGDSGRERLFIDWKRRPAVHHHHHYILKPPCVGGRSSATAFNYQLRRHNEGRSMTGASATSGNGELTAVAHCRAATKRRVRLFGVNLDCPDMCRDEAAAVENIEGKFQQSDFYKGASPAMMVTQTSSFPPTLLPDYRDQYSVRRLEAAQESSSSLQSGKKDQPPLDLAI